MFLATKQAIKERHNFTRLSFSLFANYCLSFSLYWLSSNAWWCYQPFSISPRIIIVLEIRILDVAYINRHFRLCDNWSRSASLSNNLGWFAVCCTGLLRSSRWSSLSNSHFLPLLIIRDCRSGSATQLLLGVFRLIRPWSHREGKILGWV